jgi:hypothetical protein
MSFIVFFERAVLFFSIFSFLVSLLCSLLHGYKVLFSSAQVVIPLSISHAWICFSSFDSPKNA